ncbi:MAG: nicotinate (nicotinamide) nucleotide adenylyltransferase, partial [Clostridiaceae bacterium]|nr:nicotinate (nicotinamide) nucleotide adenylyltransferase [Clostridiaceae bacterium]
MKIGICGGTYDPLHNGHEALMRSVLAEGLVDRVIVIPAGQPPHKRQSRVSMSRYRYEMAACTFSDEPRIMVSDIEIKKDSPSYTLDTAAQLQERFPDDRLVLIYGSDVLVDIRSWHQPLELLARWPLLIADRGGLQASESRRIAADLSRDTGAQIDFFPAPQIDLSSTTIRNLAADSQPLANYV